MKKIILPLVLSLPIYVAANEMSAGAAIGLWEYDLENVGTYDSSTLEASFNYEVIDSLDASVRLGVGVGHDTSGYRDSSNLVSRVFVTSHVEAYLKPKYQVNDFELYALLGLASIKMDVEVEDLSDGSVTKGSGSESGFAYGVGLSYKAFDENSLFVEWRQLPDGKDYDLASINLGLSIPL